MSSYLHPDHVCMALARGTADASMHPPGSLPWHEAYRRAYLEQNADEAGVASYLHRLDAAVEKMRSRRSRRRWRAFYAVRALLLGPERMLWPRRG